jgi:hypothetical protein
MIVNDDRRQQNALPIGKSQLFPRLHPQDLYDMPGIVLVKRELFTGPTGPGMIKIREHNGRKSKNKSPIGRAVYFAIELANLRLFKIGRSAL